MFWERYWLPRPRCEDGNPVKHRDIVLVDGKAAFVRGIHVNVDGSFWLDVYVFESGTTIGKGFERGERVKRLTPWDVMWGVE